MSRPVGQLDVGTAEPIRVAVCYTGEVGRRAIALIAERSDMVLVAALTHDAAKDGVDAGVLAGLHALRVPATTAVDDVVAARPDCAIWAGRGWQPAEVCTLLRAGIDVYTPIGAWYLPGDPDFETVESACNEGGSTIVGGGNIRGLVSDVLPLFLSGYVGHVRHVRMEQRNLIGDYPSAEQLRTGLGLGAPVPPTAVEPDERDRRWMRYLSQSSTMVADALGFDFGVMRLAEKEFAVATRELRLPNGLTIAPDTVAGVRWTFEATTRAGEPFYSMTKEQVAVIGLGPGWRASARDPQWRVEIDGIPSLACEVTPLTTTGFGETTAELNAARAVNMVPRIVSAPPGCRSVLDLPAPVGAI